MKKTRFVGFYDYTVVLTYAAMICSFFGVIKAEGGQYRTAVFLLMCAGVFDMFDGAVARTKKNRTEQEKKFGIQIDSLCDLVSFGVAPAFFAYYISGEKTYSAVISAVYALCALIRLAYYNVVEEERQSVTDSKRTSFLGVPVTTIALLVPAAYILVNSGLLGAEVVFPVLLAGTAFAFVAPVEVPKPGSVGKVVMVVLGLAEVAGMFLV